MTTKGKTAIALAIIMLVPPFVQPAAARQPQITRFEFNVTFEDPSCGFTLEVEADVKVRETIFFDRAGNPIRLQALVKVIGTATNVDNGKFLTQRNVTTESFDLPNPEKFTTVGLFAHLKLPGGGTLLVDTGKIVFDANGNIIFQAGPHPFAEADFQAPPEVCLALL